MNNNSFIQSLGIKAQHIMSRCLDHGMLREAKQIQAIDKHLYQLLYHKNAFDFIAEAASGSALLVGEGNLSFTRSLIRKTRIVPNRLTATTYERETELTEEAVTNARTLKQAGVAIAHGVDATQLARTFGARQFDSIIFQFPHAGNREPVEGRNPNFILVRNFLESASRHVGQNGAVMITAVNSPHYQGAFQFEEAAEKTGFKEPVVYPFDLSDFPGYIHSMTHDEEGDALGHHKNFKTWVFRR